jgi:hypothetical protein
MKLDAPYIIDASIPFEITTVDEMMKSDHSTIALKCQPA